jgi:hypothetical protein
VIDWYEAHGVRIVRIDGTGPLDTVMQRILDGLGGVGAK